MRFTKTNAVYWVIAILGVVIFTLCDYIVGTECLRGDFSHYWIGFLVNTAGVGYISYGTYGIKKYE